MSDQPRDDLLVILFETESSGVIEEVMTRALAGMTSLGWTPKDSIDTWRKAIGAGSIRYNARRQPTLSASGRALTIGIREERANGLFRARRVPKEPNQ
jgi:hypothetical protein